VCVCIYIFIYNRESCRRVELATAAQVYDDYDDDDDSASVICNSNM